MGIRAQAAVERLYESANVRDELTDDEADALLKWAEAEAARLDQPETSDDAYNEQVDTLLSLLKQINRYAGRQGQAAAQGVDEAPAKIAGLAAALGHTTAAEQVAGAGTGDPMGTVGALTALLSRDSADQAVVASTKDSPVLPVASPRSPEQAPAADVPSASRRSPEAPESADTHPLPSESDKAESLDTHPLPSAPIETESLDSNRLLPSGDEPVDL